MARAKNFLAEAAQFVPVITLASSFILAGGVDLSRAALLFVIAALGAVAVTAVLTAKKVLLNPVLLGTNLWLCIGALAFGVPVSPLADAVGRAQAFGLYVCMFGVGLVLTVVKDSGYIGVRHPDRQRIRKWSLVLLGLTAGALVWSYVFIDNIRLGGALPFILVNVIRRVMIKRSGLSIPPSTAS
jgi:hypothetical protein